jgi:hypothetical protein
MTAANRIGWIVAVVGCAGSVFPACSPAVDSGSVDGGNGTGTADVGSPGSADGGNSGSADAGSPGSADGGNSGSADGGNSGSADAGSPGSADGGNSGSADGGNSGSADGGNSGSADGGNSGSTDGGDPGAADAGNETVPDEAAFGRKYKFSDDEIAGWKQATSDTAYSVWTAANLFDKLGNAAIAYITYECQLAMYQDLVGPNSRICTVVAMDFGTDVGATSMFSFQQDQTKAAVTIPSYDSAVAIGAETLTGITTVFAHFNASYFELHLHGYPDPASAAQAAPQFLDVLKRKTQ